jgi:hypothetical protein
MLRSTRPSQQLRRAAAALCYADHSARCAALVPSQPTAAFTGKPLPGHLLPSLEAHARRMRYHSPYWLSGAQLNKRGVPLKPGQAGIVLPAEPGTRVDLVVCNFADLPAQDADYFLLDVPLPADHAAAAKPYLFKNGKWKQPGDQASVNRLCALKDKQGFPTHLWISREDALALQMDPRAGAAFASIVDGSTTTLFNADQTTLDPRRFVPAYLAPSEGAADFGAVAAHPAARFAARDGRR